jgi:transposase-like protein
MAENPVMNSNSPRRKNTKQFKQQAVHLAEEIDFQEAAEQLEVGRSLLNAWQRSLSSEGPEALRGLHLNTYRPEAAFQICATFRTIRVGAGSPSRCADWRLRQR